MFKLASFLLAVLLLAAIPAFAQLQTLQFGSGHAVALKSNGDVFT